MRVAIDTNVVLSALLFRGRTSIIRSWWRNRAITPLATAEIFAEYARALTYRKFGLKEDDIRTIFETEIWPHFMPVKPRASKPRKIPAEAGDVPFVVAGATGDVRAIVSGDKHLLSLHEVGGVPILQPGQFVQRFFPEADSLE
jgi:predicted nucleic acid-binding protein